MNKKYLGSFYALLSAGGFGVVPILALYAYQGGIDVVNLLILRFSVVSILLFLYIFIKIKKINISWRQVLYLFILGGFFYAVFSISYFTAIRHIPASLAVIVFYTYPILVALISYFLGERLTKEIVISIVLSFIGLILVMGNIFSSINFFGVLLAFIAALSYATYTLYGDYLIKEIPLIVTIAFSCFFAAIIFLTIGLFSGTLYLDFEIGVWITAVSIALISMIGFLTFFQAIKLTTPTSVAVLGMIEPLVTIFLSILLFEERLDFIQIIGAILVLAGSVIIVLKVNTENNVEGEDLFVQQNE